MGFLDLAVVLFTSMILSVLLIPVILYIAHSRKIYDTPDHMHSNGRRVHLQPTPRLGGIAIVGSFFLTLCIWNIPFFSKPIFFASLVFFFVGLFDDLKSLSAKFRLVVQIAVSLAVVIQADLAFKNLVINANYFVPIPHFLGILLSTFVLIGAINSMNMIDGLDGLAGGVVLIAISILSYFLFLHTYKHELLMLFTVPILGSIIGFLKYNTYPSKIFMGDSGSNWLGFMMGILILVIANTTNIPTISILLTFSIPIFDTAHVIILRLLAGKNPMIADDQHFHHSLMKIGFTHAQSVGIIYLFMFVFGFIGMLPVALSSTVIWWLPWAGAMALMSVLIVTIYLRKQTQEKKILINYVCNQSKYIKKSLHFFIVIIESTHRFLLSFLLVTVGVSGVFCNTSKVMFFLSLPMIILAFRFLFFTSCSFVSACLLVAISSLIFAIGNLDAVTVDFFAVQFKLQTAYNYIFLILFLGLILLFSVKIRRGFFVTPTDVLLILGPLLILMIPNTLENEYGLRVMILRGLVLFGALRICSKEFSWPSNELVLAKSAI